MGTRLTMIILDAGDNCYATAPEIRCYNQGMDAKAVHVPDEKIEQFCRKHHIRKLSFFGSVVRDDFGPHSDIDVLVEFEPGHTPGFGFFLIEAELSEILGRKVDLQTVHFLSPQIRSHAIVEAVRIYPF